MTESDFRYAHCYLIVKHLAHYFLIYEEIDFGSVDHIIHYCNFPLKEMSDANELLWEREDLFVFCRGQLLLSHLH